MTKIKLVDVAAEAGVSKSTVSQFLNGRYDYMSTSTRARIQKAVDDLNYVPNRIASSLKTNKTKTVGVIVRDIAGFYTSQALRGMDDYCKAHGYNLFIYNSDFDETTEERALKSLKQLSVDGLIIAPSGKNSQLVSELSDQNMPVVHFQLEHEESDKNIILSDYKQAAFEATEYLIQLGHKRIAFLTQDYRLGKSRFDRIHGYSEALEKYNIEFDESLICIWSREEGFTKAPKAMLAEKNPPTAFFAQHLAITTDLLQILDMDKFKIPEDVSVLSFDDLPMAEFFKVPVTAIKQDPYEVGKHAAEVLISKLQDPDQPLKRVMVPCTLVKRDSCKRI